MPLKQILQTIRDPGLLLQVDQGLQLFPNKMLVQLAGLSEDDALDVEPILTRSRS